MGNRKHKRNIFNRSVTFTVEDVDYVGTIDNISPEGVHVITDAPVRITEGEDITITVANADMEKDIKVGKIIWADESGFGAKFRN
jgi:hypothetical protein